MKSRTNPRLKGLLVSAFVDVVLIAAIIRCNKRPVPHAFTRNVHIAVRARRFGGIVVPVRRTEIPSSIVRDQDVRVVVALIPVDP